MSEPIEGEVVRDLPAEQPDQLPQQPPPQPAAPAVFNPLDADPEHFKREVAQRQENYEALKQFLRDSLVPGKDFGRIHVSKDCDNKYQCDNPYHFSDNGLFDPGADKILGLLGLAMFYESTDAYRKATLQGVQIQDVWQRGWIAKPDSPDIRISEGEGAASVSEHNGAVLNNTIKKARKRCRIDAVQRLPVVSALFEDDFFDTLPPGSNAAPKKPQAQKYDTGVELDAMPFGKHKNTPFADLDVGYLHWAANLDDKPDVKRSAQKELARRGIATDAPVEAGNDWGAPETPPARPSAPPRQKNASERARDAATADFEHKVPDYLREPADLLDDDLPPLDSY